MNIFAFISAYSDIIGPCGTNHCWGKPSSLLPLPQICVEGKWHGCFLVSRKGVPQECLLPVAPKSKGVSCDCSMAKSHQCSLKDTRNVDAKLDYQKKKIWKFLNIV